MNSIGKQVKGGFPLENRLPAAGTAGMTGGGIVIPEACPRLDRGSYIGNPGVGIGVFRKEVIPIQYTIYKQSRQKQPSDPNTE